MIEGCLLFPHELQRECLLQCALPQPFMLYHRNCSGHHYGYISFSIQDSCSNIHMCISIQLVKLNYASFMPHKYISLKLQISTYFRTWKKNILNSLRYSQLLFSALGKNQSIVLSWFVVLTKVYVRQYSMQLITLNKHVSEKKSFYFAFYKAI